MKPELRESVAGLIALGCTRIWIIPVFLGEGGHVRRDLPALVDQLRLEYPDVAITSTLAVGEEPGVLNAIASYCLRAIDSDPGTDYS